MYPLAWDPEKRCQNRVSMLENYNRSGLFTKGGTPINLTKKEKLKQKRGCRTGVGGEDFHTMMQVWRLGKKGERWELERRSLRLQCSPTRSPRTEPHRLPRRAEVARRPSVPPLCPSGVGCCEEHAPSIVLQVPQLEVAGDLYSDSWLAVSFLKRDRYPSAANTDNTLHASIFPLRGSPMLLYQCLPFHSIFHCTDVSVYPFPSWWTLVLFPVWGDYEWSYYK